MIHKAERKFDCYFPYFFETSVRFQFGENRIILHKRNGGMRVVELGLSIKIKRKGRRKEKKGYKKADLTGTENCI